MVNGPLRVPIIGCVYIAPVCHLFLRKVKGVPCRVMGAETREGAIGRTLQNIDLGVFVLQAGAGGFCIFNDIGVAIETLRSEYNVERIAYVDIDAHHGDGVFYSYEDDPNVIIADIHEDGRFLYPGTGFANETGKGKAEGTKLNIPMPPSANDEQFAAAWKRVDAFLTEQRPEFILLQAGADSIHGDPITHMEFTASAHAMAAQSLARIADELCDGRLVATGGGGYNRDNLAAAWTGVVKELVGS